MFGQKWFTPRELYSLRATRTRCQPEVGKLFLGRSWRFLEGCCGTCRLRISIFRETRFGSLLPPVSFRNLVFAWDFLETLRKVETLGLGNIGEPWKWETCWNHLKPKSSQIRALVVRGCHASKSRCQLCLKQQKSLIKWGWVKTGYPRIGLVEYSLPPNIEYPS